MLDYHTDDTRPRYTSLLFPAFQNIFFAAVWVNAVIRLLDPVAKL